MQSGLGQPTWAAMRRPSIYGDDTSRPHTVHGREDNTENRRAAASQTSLVVGGGGNRLPGQRSQTDLLRDDTAADVLFFGAETSANFARPALDCGLAALSEDGRSPYVRQQRRPERKRNPFRNFGSFSQGTPLETISNEAEHAPRETTTLGRSFSKKMSTKVRSFGESMQGTWSMPIAARSRRSSTPHNLGTQQQVFVQPAPASPSKRNGSHGDDRPKKARPNLHIFGDRKDTPAPASTANGCAKRPASRSNPPWPVIATGGGEGARKAAADSNVNRFQMPNPSVQPRFNSDWDTMTTAEDEDMHMRDLNRARLGSLSSAADSGADLSTYSGSSHGDAKMDGADVDFDMFIDTEPEDKRMDFTKGVLPDEISLQVFKYLDATDLSRASLMSRKWFVLTNDISVWRSTFLNEYERQIHTDPPPIQVGGVGVGRPNRPNQEWYKMYKARLELEANWRKGAKDAGKAVYLSGHTDSVYCLQFDEEKIITGSRDRTIRVWDINTYQCLRVIGGPNVKPALGPKVLRTVDYPSFHMATASVNGTNYGNQIYHVPSQWHDASILCLQYDDKILVTGSSDSDLLIWDLETYEPIRRLHKHSGGVLDVALDAKHIVSCSKDSRIIVWDRQTYEPKAVLTGHRGPVNAVQLRGNFLVSASGDGIARLWDLTTMKLTKEFSAKERGLAAVEFSEDMKYVLAGGNDHITYKFETDTGREVAQFVGHTQLVRSLWLDSANKRVVSGSYDLDLRVYDFDSGRELWRAEEWTTSWMLAAKSDYRRIVATSQDGRILIVDFGLKRGGREDGQPIDNVNLLRGIDKTNEIEWRNPW